MAFNANGGFQYVEGPNSVRWSTVSSTASFDVGAPVSFAILGSTVVHADSVDTVYGVAQSRSDKSLGGPLAGKVPIMIPMPGTVFEAPVDTDLTAAEAAPGSIHAIEINGGIARVNEAINTSGQIILVERGTSGSALDSANSSVLCQFLGDSIAIFNSHASSFYA